MKETYYFAHDYNARNDDKLLELRDKYKNEGYAVYFYCVETMAEKGDGYIIPSLIGGLSLGYGVAKEWLKEFLDFCVEIKLLNKDEKGYFSQRMIEHLAIREMFKQQGIKGAKIRWKNSPPISPPNAKERKVKESKVKETNKTMKNKKFFLNQRRAEIGKPPMQYKFSEKQWDFFDGCQLIPIFKKAVIDVKKLSYWEHPDDVADLEKENSRINGQIKIFWKRCDKDLEKAKKVIEWYAGEYGKWKNWSPGYCFRKDTVVDFENKKEKKGGAYKII